MFLNVSISVVVVQVQSFYNILHIVTNLLANKKSPHFMDSSYKYVFLRTIIYPIIISVFSISIKKSWLDVILIKLCIYVTLSLSCFSTWSVFICFGDSALNNLQKHTTIHVNPMQLKLSAMKIYAHNEYLIQIYCLGTKIYTTNSIEQLSRVKCSRELLHWALDEWNYNNTNVASLAKHMWNALWQLMKLSRLNKLLDRNSRISGVLFTEEWL